MHERIEINPAIQGGKPVIRGTRVPVVAVLGELAEGMSAPDIAAEYRIEMSDVTAAIAYAADLVAQVQHDEQPV